MSDRAMLDIAASVWGEKIRPMQATIDRQLSAISELQRDNDRLREALTRIRYGGKRQKAWLIADAALKGATE